MTDNLGDGPPLVPPGSAAYPGPQYGPPPYFQQPGYPYYPYAPTQFAPQPRRPKRRWPWVLGGIVGVSVMASVVLAPGTYLRALSIFDGPQREYTLVYEVTGTATSANILYALPDDDPVNSSQGDGPQMTLPWRKEVTVRARGDGVYVNLRAIAAGPKGIVKCRITANSTVIDEDPIGEAYTSCSGNANTDAVRPTPRSTESSSAPPGPPPNSDLIPELVLPAGSIAEGGYDPDGTRESWEMTVPYPDAVKALRAQLPIGRDYHGLRWCDEHVENELTMWTWGDKNDLLYVLVDGAERTGSRVAITHKAPSPTGC